MPDLRLTLPLPPSCNHSHYRNRHVKKSTRAWRREALTMAWSAVACQHWTTIPAGELAQVQLTWRWPDNRRRDPGNYAKELMDILTAAGVWTDDQWTVVHDESFTVDRTDPGVDVVVRRAT